MKKLLSINYALIILAFTILQIMFFGILTNADIYNPQPLPPTNSINTSMVQDGAITDAKINATANVAYSKLNLAGSITNSDIASGAAINGSKISGLINMSFTATAGENITPYSAVSVGNGVTSYIALNNATGSVAWTIDGDTARHTAQSLTGADINATATKILIKLAKTGNPVDSIILNIRQDTATGTALASSTISGSSLTVTMTNYILTLNNPVRMASGTTYFIDLSRTGASSTVDFYATLSQTPDSYPGGNLWYLNQTSWTSYTTYDLFFQVITKTQINNIYKADVSDATQSAPVVGIVNTNLAVNATGTVQVSGLISTSTWNWIPGGVVYVTGVNGGLSQTAGTTTKSVGRAVSSTTINVLVVPGNN